MNHFAKFFKVLVLALIVAGCQQPTTPGSPSPGVPGASPTAATTSGQLEVKIGEGKDVSFGPASGWWDPRGDTKEASLSLGSYEFVVTPRNTYSVPDVKEGQTRVIVTLKGPEGAEFNQPVPPGEYTGESVRAEVVYFDNQAERHYNLSEPQGKVVIENVTDNEVTGSLDLTAADGGVLKGDFTAKVTNEETAAAGGKLPFEFPAAQPAAKKGDKVLTPMPSKVTDMLAMGNTDVSDFRPRTMEEPGEETSVILDDDDPFEMPNALIISLPADAKPKAGDIVLTHTQYGPMVRAIVTDPAGPTVHYFQKVFGSDAPEGEKFTGTLEPGSFRIMEGGLEPGAMVLHPKGDEKGLGQVINAQGDKVLVEQFGGDLAVFDASEVEVLPLKPELKEGDKVQAPFAAGVDPATVTKVDAKNGRVWVKWKDSPGDGIFSYGEVLPVKE